jgi:hypothetical protein
VQAERIGWDPGLELMVGESFTWDRLHTQDETFRQFIASASEDLRRSAQEIRGHSEEFISDGDRLQAIDAQNCIVMYWLNICCV